MSVEISVPTAAGSFSPRIHPYGTLFLLSIERHCVCFSEISNSIFAPLILMICPKKTKIIH